MIERDLEPDWIRGVNAVDNCKIRRLAQSMMEHGWQERRMLVEEADHGHFAWTGTTVLSQRALLSWQRSHARS
jgi:hypothetical protein